MNTSRSAAAFERARASIPGGVNSPVRAFRPVGGLPLFIDRALGARVWDIDGNEFIDYVGSWGPMVLGHAHPAVVAAVVETAGRGTSYGAPTEVETELAELVKGLYPSMDLLRFVSSGTEATMSALRIARGFTGRDDIIKLEGCYHGHGDSLLVKAGSGATTLGVPDSAGVPADLAKHTLTMPFNDADAVRAAFEARPGKIACVILEPVCGNMGMIQPQPGYLEALRELCTEHGALLIFDEVMTGFRIGLGGAQGHYGVTPDMTCLGKVIGGGLPVGAYGGRADVLGVVAPLGPVYQAGTLSGNPLAMNAGAATIRGLSEPGVFEAAAARTKRLVDGILAAANDAGVPLCGGSLGTMFGFYFQAGPVTDYAGAKRSDTDRFAAFHRACLEEGVYFAPSQFEAGFVSTAHGDNEIDATLQAVRKALAAL